MKKLINACFLFIAMLFIFAGCVSKNDPKEIKLSFDKSSAYFSSQIPLSPISADFPQEGDAVERASVSVTARSAELIQLSIKYDEGQSGIDGLMIAVDGDARPLTDGVILYEGQIIEEVKEFSVVIYLRQDAPVSVAGTKLEFAFILKAL